MKAITINYEIVETKVMAKVDGCDIMLKEEQLLDYLRLVDLREYAKSVTAKSDQVQVSDMIDRISKRLGI